MVDAPKKRRRRVQFATTPKGEIKEQIRPIERFFTPRDILNSSNSSSNSSSSSNTTKMMIASAIIRKKLWWSRRELKRNVASSRSVIARARNCSAYENTMTQAFQTLQKDPKSHLSPLLAQEFIYWVAIHQHQQEQEQQQRQQHSVVHDKQQPQQQYVVEDAPRGLEKMSLVELAQQRNVCRRRVIDTVLEIQEVCRNEALKPEESMALVRLASEHHSNGARRFGTILGMADALAAKLNAKQRSYNRC